MLVIAENLNTRHKAYMQAVRMTRRPLGPWQRPSLIRSFRDEIIFATADIS
ncbi:MAG: hypothetical protein M1510_12675 [Nitrospirae bacterium]|nr:hypothetical protein [Nitrospirota bacterium]MCL5236668.1 hypothetical protein [Nitrospirota bacterium]